MYALFLSKGTHEIYCYQVVKTCLLMKFKGESQSLYDVKYNAFNCGQGAYQSDHSVREMNKIIKTVQRLIGVNWSLIVAVVLKTVA